MEECIHIKETSVNREMEADGINEECEHRGL